MTLSDFYKRVAQRLGVVHSGGTLSAEDAELIGSTYQALVYELTEHDLIWWTKTDQVPDECVDILAGMTAAMLVDEFGLPEPRRSLLVTQHAFGLPMASHAERRLRAMTRSPNSSDSAIEFY